MVFMDTKNMRRLSPEVQYERRVQVIRLCKTGLTNEAIAAHTGLTPTGVFDICMRYTTGGTKALEGKLGGRKMDEHQC